MTLRSRWLVTPRESAGLNAIHSFHDQNRFDVKLQDLPEMSTVALNPQPDGILAHDLTLDFTPRNSFVLLPMLRVQLRPKTFRVLN